MLALIFVLFFAATAVKADGKLVLLHAPSGLVDTGIMKHILPRFTLKTRVKVQIVGADQSPNVTLGDVGVPLFEGAGAVWHLDVATPDHPETAKFADWLKSDVGRKTVMSYPPNGDPIFTAYERAEAAEVVTFAGDAALGREVSKLKCVRCHAVDDASRMSSIDSAPSFALLRALPDWDGRFSAFFALKPHPAFTIVTGVTPPFPENRPSPIVPVEMSIEEVEAIVAYVGAMDAADLGAPLQTK